MKKSAFLLFAALLPICISAQNTLYFMDRMPQNVLYNPASIPDVEFHLELPGIGGVSTHAYNTGFNFNELDDFIDNVGRDNYNPDVFINSIGDYNNFFSETRVNLFTLGFKLKHDDYFLFHININNVTTLNASSDFVYLFADLDNLDISEFPITADELNFSTNIYSSIGFTYSREIIENLTLGISPHINSNLIGIKSKEINYVIEADVWEGEGGREYNKSFYGDVVVGLPFELNPDAVNGDEFDLDEGIFPDNLEDEISFSDFFKNKTLSVDLGATYKLDEWLFSGSILNIGASRWKTNGYILSGNDESIRVKGNETIRIGIPVKLYLGAIRQFSPKWNYGLLLNNTFYNTKSNASATFSLNGFVGNALSTSVSYTLGYKFGNLGLGLRMRFLPGTDLYFVTDNIIQAFIPKNTCRVTAAFGINLSFGVKENNYTEDALVE